MSDLAVRLDHVYKKFRKGEIYDSLRDLLPALTGRLFRQSELSATDKREFWALQDISFEAKRGEAIGIIGHNGAGKSTMLKILSRIMKPTKGHMEVNGRLSALIEVTAGFHPDLTGRENIYLNGTILGMSRREIATKLPEIIAFSGLEEFIDTPVKRYSSGMFARLGFSVAAHVDPEVLVVDEVLSVGDYLFQQKCIARMKGVIHSGATVLFVSHNLRAVAELCPRALLLDHGKLAGSGPTNQVIRQYLDGSCGQRTLPANVPVYISTVRIRDQNGDGITFDSGQTIWIDVEVMARRPTQKLAIVFWILDDSQVDICDTSTERLGMGSFSLDAGECFTCTFEVQLNLVQGTFYPSLALHRYDIQTTYDSWSPAATIYVRSDADVRGIANCFPKITAHEKAEAAALRGAGLRICG